MSRQGPKSGKPADAPIRQNRFKTGKGCKPAIKTDGRLSVNRKSTTAGPRTTTVRRRTAHGRPTDGDGAATDGPRPAHGRRRCSDGRPTASPRTGTVLQSGSTGSVPSARSWFLRFGPSISSLVPDSISPQPETWVKSESSMVKRDQTGGTGRDGCF